MQHTQSLPTMDGVSPTARLSIDASVEDVWRVDRIARESEQAGFDGVFTSETKHDPFLPLMTAAHCTTRITLGTAVAVALARTPMTVASVAHDLQRASGGRFILGLGSQVRAHIQRRFSMPWSRPAARMREFVCALHAIWGCWNDGGVLDFRGDFYQHTLMTPFFRPEAHGYGRPRVFLAAVGDRMARVAGEVADGLLVHGFTTPRFLREVTLPAVREGRAASGSSQPFEVSCPVFVAAGDSEEELAPAIAAVRARIAFYGSTPAYRPVLDLHGWSALADELHALSRHGRWDDMTDLVDEEVLAEFAVVGAPATLPQVIRSRYAGLVDRITFWTPHESTVPHLPAILAGLREA